MIFRSLLEKSQLIKCFVKLVLQVIILCLNIVKRKNSLETINHSKIRSEKMSNVYKKSGVDVEKGYESVERMKTHVDKTTRPEVIGALGAFPGLCGLSMLVSTS